MLQCDASAKQSTIHGLGLFAHEIIPAGTAIWKFEPPFDIEFTEEQLKQLSAAAIKQVLYYSTYDAQRKVFLLSGDDDRFMNHSEKPNAIDNGYTVLAVRDIHPGEEITIDYREIVYTFKGK